MYTNKINNPDFKKEEEICKSIFVKAINSYFCGENFEIRESEDEILILNFTTNDLLKYDNYHHALEEQRSNLLYDYANSEKEYPLYLSKEEHDFLINNFFEFDEEFLNTKKYAQKFIEDEEEIG